MAIVHYDPYIAILRSRLLTNSELASFVGVWSDYSSEIRGPAIYPTYLDMVQNPVFPAITICREHGQTLKNRTGYGSLRYYIHGWIKTADGSAAPDDAGYLLNLVEDTLDVDPTFGNQIQEFAMCRKVDSRCPLYDQETRTTYFMSEWLIKARKSLVYA